MTYGGYVSKISGDAARDTAMVRVPMIINIE
jgi:hypothetical protein